MTSIASESTHTNVEETDNLNSFERITRVHGTPFTLVKEDEDNGFLVIGRNRITETEPIHELLGRVERRDWELMSLMVLALVDIKKSVDEQQEECWIEGLKEHEIKKSQN